MFVIVAVVRAFTVRTLPRPPYYIFLEHIIMENFSRNRSEIEELATKRRKKRRLISINVKIQRSEKHVTIMPLGVLKSNYR